MNLRTTLILIALLAVVGGYLAWDLVRSGAPASDASAAGGGGPVLPLVTRDFRGIRVSPAEGPVVELRIIDGDQWELGDPPVPAGTTAMTDYLTRLQSIRSTGPAPAALQEGFSPAVTVTLNILGGRIGEIAVARPNAVGDTVARVTLDGRTRWWLVPRETADLLLRDADSFRESRFVTVPADEIGMLTFQTPDRWLRVTRDADGWGFDFGAGTAPALSPTIAPGTYRAEAFVVADLIRSLTSLRAAAFATGLGLDDGFDAPQLTVRYTRFDATSEVPGIPGERMVRFGRFEDVRRERVLALSETPPVRGMVTAAAYASLQVTPEQVRDRRVIPGLTAEQITALTIIRGETTTTLVRPTDAEGRPMPWRVGDRPAEPGKIGELLAEIASLRATRYIAEPLAEDTITLIVTAGERSWTLRVGADRLELAGSEAAGGGELRGCPPGGVGV